MKLIPLTKGNFVEIDDEDYYWISQWNWMTSTAKNTRYAIRSKKKGVLRTGEKYEVSLHRVIMRAGPDQVVHHKDHNGLNCQKSNLVLCTSEENKRHLTSRKNSSSKYLGVNYDKARKKWAAQICHNGVKFPRIRFDDEINAAIYYDRLALKYHGDFANLNFKDAIYEESFENFLARTRSRKILLPKKIRPKQKKKVINNLTGAIYESAKDAIPDSGYSQCNFYSKLRGFIVNNTNFKYL